MKVSIVNYPSAIPPDTLVDRRYRVEKILGQGGFGRTYLVKDQNSFDKRYVLKEFVPNATDEYVVTKSRELFEREAKVLNKLEHPQIPKFYGWFEENERLFLVQTYIDGQTYSDILHQHQKQGKTFSEAEVVQLLKDLLPVLDYIHRNNIIHRDISPDNIMLCNKAEKPMLIDFGIVNQPGTEPTSDMGTSVGKIGYSPPEQLLMGRYYPNSDLYALGVTVLFLLTGKHPQELIDNSTMKLQWKHCTNISKSLEQILDKMLAENPQNRYQSAREVLNQLSSQVTMVDSPSLKPQNKLKTYLIGSAVAACAVMGFLFFLTPDISELCNILNNCSRDVRFWEKYEQTMENATPTLAMIGDSQALAKLDWEQLKDARNNLKRTIADLQTIPKDAKIHPKAQQTLEDIQAQLRRLDEEMKIKEPIW